VPLDLAHRVDDRRNRAAREGALQLRDEVARLVGAPRDRQQRDRQEKQWHEREQGEVRDHRGEVRASVGEELAKRLGQRRHHARVWAVDWLC
jgi:hypothetical protein